MRILFLFLDGVGLGEDDEKINPFAAAKMPNLDKLLNRRKLLLNHHPLPISTQRATLIALDACLGIDGRPQSATGQASLLTGKNVPKMLGQHFGPKPNMEIRKLLTDENLFSKLKRLGFTSCVLNAFPNEYFEAINSGRRLPGAVAMAARAASIPLKTPADLINGQAISADFTARGWRDHLNYRDTPVITPKEAGVRLSKLTQKFDLTFFEYWLSDYAGHKRNMEDAINLLTTFDQVLGGLLSTWQDDKDLILITSDHGNLEDLRIRNHTRNPVPAIIIGSQQLRQLFTKDIHDLTDIFPAILESFENTRGLYRAGKD